MVYIDYSSISESLSEFGYFMHERDDLLDKVNFLAAEFNLDVDDFIDELLASAVNIKKLEIDIGVLEHMEAGLCKKLKKNLGKVLTPSFSKSKRTAFGERHVNEYSLDISCTEIDTSMHDDFGSTQLTGKYRAFAPVQSSPSSAKYQARIKRNFVLREVKGELFVSNSVVGGPVQVNLLSLVPADKYAFDKAPNIIDELSEDLPLSDQSVSLLMDDEAGTIIKLDLTRLPEVTIFPGQIVALFGSFENGERFVASLQLFPTSLPLSTLGRCVTEENLRLWCACGPFTSNDNCSYEHLCDLLEMVKEQQPHVLVLMGPFVERKNTFMKLSHFSEEYGSVMDQLMRKIAKSLEGCRTELVIQPAPFRDACCNPIFPTSPFEIGSGICKKMGHRLHSMPEPCVVRINGIEIALTNNEIVSHLSKNEWHRSADQENRDRIGRLVSHILEQASLYPLFPPGLPSSVEDCIKICSIQSAPHLIICPSLLASFIKIFNKTVIVNPGITARGASGTFLRCEFATSITQDASSLPDCSRFEIVQL